MEIFIFLFIILYLITAVQELEWAVILILAGLPLYLIRFDIFGLPLTVLEAMILTSFTVWFFGRTECKNFLKRKYGIKDFLKNRKKRRSYPFGPQIMVFLAISFVSLAMAGFDNASLGIWKAYFFEPLLVFILVLNVLKPLPKTEPAVARGNGLSLFWDRILWPLFFSALAVSAIALLQRLGFLYSPENFWPRITGPFPYPNALGLYLGPLIPLVAVYLVWLSSGLKLGVLNQFKNNKAVIFKIFFLLITLISALGVIIMARSEGALIGLLAAGLIMSIFAISQKREKLLRFFKGGVWAILVFVVLSPVFFLKAVPEYKFYNSPAPTVNYLTDKALLKDFSGEVRKQQWRETLRMLSRGWHWLAGTGLSRYQISVKPYHQEGIFFNEERDPDFRTKIVWFDEKYKAEHWRPVEIYMYPHNLILNFWSELGIFGALLFIWIIGKYLYIGLKLYNSQPKTGLARAENDSNNNIDRFIILGLIGAMIVIVIHGIVDVPYFKNDLAVMFWVLVAAMAFVDLKKAA